MAADGGQLQRLQAHLDLLKQQHRKLQAQNTDLKKQLATYQRDDDGKGTSNDTLSYGLSKLVAGLFDKQTYSDIVIKVEGKPIYAHKIVLGARGVWTDDNMSDLSELELLGLGFEAGWSLIRWVYTDQIDQQRGMKFCTELLSAAHKFKLNALKIRCEQLLIAEVDITNCVKILTVAHEVEAEELKQFTSTIVMDHWDEISPQDFASLSAALLYEMIKKKTNYPLHRAIMLAREDVVFLYLIEHDMNLSVKINEADTNGETALDLALKEHQENIANTLISHHANVNATHANGTILHAAIRRKDNFAAKFLIENGANLDLPTTDKKQSPLHIAAEENLEEIARLLLQNNANVNALDSTQNTPIQTAITASHAALVTLFLETPNVDVNTRNAKGHTALWLALGLPDQSFARTLVSRGCDINLVTSTGDSMLHDAIRSKNSTAALFLIEYGASVTLANQSQETPLHVAAEVGLDSVAIKILEKNVNCNTTNRNVQTPLQLAIANNNKRVVDILLQQSSIDVNQCDLEGRCALGLALEQGNMEVAQLLIDRGADAEAPLPSGQTLLHSCILRGDKKSCQFLVNNAANVEAKTGDGQTALQLAITHEEAEIVNILCTAGADPNVPDSDGVTPLWMALRAHQEDIARTLVQHRCDINSSSSGETALHTAIRDNDNFSACFLIENGADIDNCENEAHESALHLASQLGQDDVVKSLLKQNANVNIQDSKGLTPIHRAILHKQSMPFQLLLKHPDIDLKLQDAKENTPFGIALVKKDGPVAGAILRRDSKVKDHVNSKGMTYLHKAIARDDEETVQLLLKLGVDVNKPVKDSAARTPLAIAVERGQESIVRGLLASGANHAIPDRHSKWTVAHVAASLGAVDILILLAKQQANMNAVDDLGESVLHAAVRAGHAAAVKALLKVPGVDVDAVNHQQQTVLHILSKYPKESAAAILEALLPRVKDINAQDVEGTTPLYYAYSNGADLLCKGLIRGGAHIGIPNKHGGTCFDVQVPSKKLLGRLIHMIPKEPAWVESSNCQVCLQKFGMSTRKHHCRHCGRVLCKKCSSQQTPIEKFGLQKPVRVCDDCHVILGHSKQ